MAHHGRHGRHGTGIVGLAVSGEAGSGAGSFVNGGGRVGCFARECVSFFWPRKNAEKRGKSHGDGSFALPKGCSAQRELRPPRIAVNTSGDAVCTCAQDFALSPFFWPRKNAEERGKSHGHGGGLFQPRKTRFSVFSGWWLPCVAGFTGVVAVLRCFGLVAIA